MSGDTRIPRDMCAGNTIPGETRIPMTPAMFAPVVVIREHLFKDLKLKLLAFARTSFCLAELNLDSLPLKLFLA